MRLRPLAVGLVLRIGAAGAVLGPPGHAGAAVVPGSGGIPSSAGRFGWSVAGLHAFG